MAVMSWHDESESDHPNGREYHLDLAGSVITWIVAKHLSFKRSELGDLVWEVNAYDRVTWEHEHRIEHEFDTADEAMKAAEVDAENYIIDALLTYEEGRL